MVLLSADARRCRPESESGRCLCPRFCDENDGLERLGCLRFYIRTIDSYSYAGSEIDTLNDQFEMTPKDVINRTKTQIGFAIYMSSEFFKV